MATRLYEYGQPNMVIKQNQWLPGRFATTWGVPLTAPGVIAPTLSVEYGEILEISQSGIDSNSYVCTRVDSGTTDFGVLLRTTDGGINMEDGYIERPRVNTPHSIYPLGAPNYFMVAVPIVADQTVTVGNDVYVNYDGDTAGAVQTDGSDATELTDWVFASEPFTPTTSDDEVVLIQKSI